MRFGEEVRGDERPLAEALQNATWPRNGGNDVRLGSRRRLEGRRA
jgi:hypothetical protein